MAHLILERLHQPPREKSVDFVLAKLRKMPWTPKPQATVPVAKANSLPAVPAAPPAASPAAAPEGSEAPPSPPVPPSSEASEGGSDLAAGGEASDEASPEEGKEEGKEEEVAVVPMRSPDIESAVVAAALKLRKVPRHSRGTAAPCF